MVLVQIIRFRRKLARSRAPVAEELQALFQECQRDFGLLTSIKLFETDAVQSPALFGLWRLTLLLPRGVSGQFTRSELRYIFLHEIAHVQRGDLWLNWLVTWLQMMHWFNPLIWFGFARLRADRELACDELALLRAGDLSGTAYGETVLKLLENLRPAAAIPGLIGILEDRKQMHRRISIIANFRRPGRWSVLAVLLVIAVATVALTDAPANARSGYKTVSYHVTSSGSTNFAFVVNGNRHRSGRKSKRIPPAIVRWHFRGLQFLETQTVAPTVARVASMPEAEASSGGTDEGDWIPLLPGSFLNLDGDSSVLFSGSSEDCPRFQLSAELATNRVMTHATLDFMTPPLGPLPEWRLPEKMAHAPFTQFTAFRGGRSWLERQAWAREIFGKETPDQVFAWSTADGQMCSWLAVPVADPRGNLERIFSTLEPHFGTNGFLFGRLELATNHEAVAVFNPLGIKPVIAHIRQGDQDFLFGALFPGGASTRPIPRGLLAMIAEPNLVYQDVEFSPESIQHWNAIFQCYQVLKGHPVNASKAQAHPWMWSAQSELGDAVTAVHRVSPTQFTLERSSTIGFTGLELVLATRWLDGPIKPVLVGHLPKP